MKLIRYTAHLELRLKLRGIPHGIPEKIYRTSHERYWDSATAKYIALKRITIDGRMREYALTYEESAETVALITIHPLKISQKQNRVRSKRWQPL